MTNCYESPLSSRYASEYMLSLFSADTRYQTWRKLWTALAREEMNLGLPITAQQVDELSEHITDIDYDCVAQREREVRHDVMAHIYANTIWVLLGAALVFFMQAGFAMCEAGFTRAKNTGNILMKNLMDFCIGTPLYWLFGFGIMFGTGTAVFGWIDPFIMREYGSVLPQGVPLWAYAIFQTVFCATSATIVSGAMAERTKFSAYCLYSAAISLFIYPVSGHWIWGGGWLSELGFHDFAGSTAVHMVGGVCALIGAKMLGPRIGKYGKDGKPKAILGHNLSIAALGVFILWFCWFGFNGASTVGMDSDELITSAGDTS